MKKTFTIKRAELVCAVDIGRWLYNRLEEEGISMKPLKNPWDRTYPDGLEIEELYPDGFSFVKRVDFNTGDTQVTWWIEE